jgi:hypothetical protein
MTGRRRIEGNRSERFAGSVMAVTIQKGHSQNQKEPLAFQAGWKGASTHRRPTRMPTATAGAMVMAMVATEIMIHRSSDSFGNFPNLMRIGLQRIV